MFATLGGQISCGNFQRVLPKKEGICMGTIFEHVKSTRWFYN